ncbi:MAG: ATP-binding protein, partial [Acidimicrobiia bacterium]
MVRLGGGLLDDLAGLLRSAAATRGGIPDREPSRAQLIEGLAVLLTNLARDSPVLILLDDVHVADASSWNALAYLARNLANLPVLVIAAARTGELAAQAGPTQAVLGLEQDGSLCRLELQPLTEAAIAELAESMVGRSPPAALIGWLMDRSRGNPLFARGLLQALLDEGADLKAPQLRRLPEGLAERVAAGVDGLPGTARDMVELLAVLGRRIELGDLVDVSGQSLAQVGPILDGLVRERFILAAERGRAVTYEVLHPLVQDAIYQGLEAARRHGLHRHVGRSLLAAGQLGEAAPHFARSAEVGDTEAIEALCGAMRQAEDRQAYREAKQLYLEVGNRQGALLAGLEEIFAQVFAGPCGRWVPDSQPLAEVAQAAGDRLATMHIVGRGIGWGGFWTGRFDEAKPAFQRAIDLAREDGKTYFHSLCLGGMGFTLAFEGNIAQAGRYLSEAKAVNPQ